MRSAFIDVQFAVMALRVRASALGSSPTRAPPRGMPAITSARALPSAARVGPGETSLADSGQVAHTREGSYFLSNVL